MAICTLCPNRSFKDEKALSMHKETKHAGHACDKCGRVFQSQQALEQHIADRHPVFECRYCDRTFPTDNGRVAHERDKHPSIFECPYCDKVFTTDAGRSAHQNVKHTTFECDHCDEEFPTNEGRLAHQKAEHSPKFKCRYCDSEFNSDTARLQHQCDKHAIFECLYCDTKFLSVKSRRLHQDAKHTTSKCTLCGQSFVGAEALQLHEKTPHSKCKYCPAMFSTRGSQTTHEVSCVYNPVNYIKPPTSTLFDPPLRPVSQSSSRDAGSTENAEEERSASTSAEHTDEGSESPASPSPSNSSLGEGEMFHSISGATPTDGEVAPDEQPCRCERSLEHCECSICHRLSSADKPAQDDRESIVSSDDDDQDGSTDRHNVAFRCMLCMEFFDSEEASRSHICVRTTMLRPHCPHCYSQFDDTSLLQQHLEGLESVSCQLCLTRCCSDEMMQDHLLSHPMCSKCGKSFADDLALCAHVESDHPAVVCWDCDGIVVEHSTLELHYADSPVHPSCVFCGLGKRNPAVMDEHLKHAHPGAEIEQHPESNNVSLDAESLDEETPGMNRDDTVRSSCEELDRTPVVMDQVGQPGDEIHNSPLQTESSLSSSPKQSILPEVESVNGLAANVLDAGGEELPDAGVPLYVPPSPAPSEHGSDINVSQMRLHASGITHAAVNNDTRPPSPVSTMSAEAFSDLSTPSSSTTSSDSSHDHSIVFVSADGIPDYIRENRAMLVATSAGSPSSGRTPLRLPSSSSLESLEMVARTADEGSTPTSDAAAPPQSHADNPTRLHCRICMQDPCEDMTATICGHLFCKRCITQAVVAKSECPVCKSATLLYCLFKLDLSV